MHHREFIYVGEQLPELTPQNHSSFLMLIQESILLSLKHKGLLDSSQYERCLIELHSGA